MPGGDRTGPMGQGPMTGWGEGYCTKRVDENAEVTDFRPVRGRRFVEGRPYGRRRFVPNGPGPGFYRRDPGFRGCGMGFRGGRFR